MTSRRNIRLLVYTYICAAARIHKVWILQNLICLDVFLYLSFLWEKSDMFVLVFFVCLVVCLHFGGTCRICNDFFAVWNTEKRVKITLRSLLGYALMLCFVYINIFSNHVFFSICIIIFLIRDALVVIISRHCFLCGFVYFLSSFSLKFLLQTARTPRSLTLERGVHTWLVPGNSYLQTFTLGSHCLLILLVQWFLFSLYSFTTMSGT